MKTIWKHLFVVGLVASCSNSSVGGGDSSPPATDSTGQGPTPSASPAPSNGTTDVDAYWRAAAKGNLYSIANASESVVAPDLSSDGTKLFAAVDDKTSPNLGGIKIWDASNGNVIKFIPRDSSTQEVPKQVALSPNGKTLAAISSDAIRLYDFDLGKMIQSIAISPHKIGNSVKFISDDRMVFIRDAFYLTTIQRDDTGAFALGSTVEVPVGSLDVFAPFICLSADNTKIASKLSSEVEVAGLTTDTISKSLGKFSDHTSTVMGVAFSPDGNLIASGRSDKTVKIWDIASGSVVRTLNANESIISVTYSPNGKYILAGGESDAHIWNAATGDLIRDLQSNKPDAINSRVVFSPDGKRAFHISAITIVAYDVQDLP